MNGPQATLQGYKEMDAASYDDAAAEFERINERFIAPLASALLALARLTPADQVLDVGTGTGPVALRAAPLLTAGGIVVGIDHSTGMLARASAKARQSGLSDRVSFQLMDAENLGFASCSFDKVLSLYALLHFPQPLRALRDMHRVLRPGGRVVIGVGCGPNLLSWNGIIRSAMRIADLVAAMRGRLLTAPDFLRRVMAEHGMVPESSRQPHRKLRIAGLMRQAGFTQIRQQWQGHREELDAEEFWDVQVVYASAERIRLQQASPNAVSALKQDFLRRCERTRMDAGNLIYRHAAMFYTATRR